MLTNKKSCLLSHNRNHKPNEATITRTVPLMTSK